jgi:hypothetical protein
MISSFGPRITTTRVLAAPGQNASQIDSIGPLLEPCACKLLPLNDVGLTANRQSLIRNFLCRFLAQPIATLSFRLFAPAAQTGRVSVLRPFYLLEPGAPTTTRRAVPVTSVARAAEREHCAATTRPAHNAPTAVQAASFSGRHSVRRENTVT